ncbi:hypothetical protein [Rhodoligotrophos defluvii]|uniref:hypothetical protein n=1 Tax=Rhodoligotrophos defluvii TaxID=2561934 RepID=UPI0010C94830|nr:hypothetical protein [Rhodoligotrophos defluvii]
MSEKLPGMPIIGNGSLFPQMPGGEGGAGGMFPGILGSILSGITSDPRLADAQGRIIERLQAALSRPGGRLAPTDTQQPPADGGSGNILQG